MSTSRHPLDSPMPAHASEHALSHGHGHDHGHSHGLLDRSIMRSRDGLRTVAVSLGVLLLTAAAQAVIFAATGSVALLGDLIHNFGDALTAVPLGIAFFLRSFVAEKRAGYFVVLAIFVSACVAAVEAVNRLLHPQDLHHLGVLAAAGAIGFIGNEIAARVRLRGGRRLNSPALIADGNHARVDGFVSLAVVASAAVVAIGFRLGDPLLGLAITLVILRISWQSIQTIKTGPGLPEPHEDQDGHVPAAPGHVRATVNGPGVQHTADARGPEHRHLGHAPARL